MTGSEPQAATQSPSAAPRRWYVPAGLGGVLGASLARALMPSLPTWITWPIVILGGALLGLFVVALLYALWRAGWRAWAYVVAAIAVTASVPLQFRILVGGVSMVVGLAILIGLLEQRAARSKRD